MKRKLNILTIEKKMEILSFLKEKLSMKKSVFTAKFGILPSTFFAIMRKKNIIQKNFKTLKKSHACFFHDVDKVLENGSNNVVEKMFLSVT